MTSKGTRNVIAHKLHSEKGASITFALLLFLVCAVLSSVILVAATTASGRMAGIAATDQRYYSVTSASELMKDLLDGKSASVVTVKTSDSETKYLFAKPAYEVESLKDGIAISSEPSSFGDIAQAAAYKYSSTSWSSTTDEVELGTYTLSVGSEDSLTVAIQAKLEADGSVVLWVQSRPDNKGHRFKQKILFSGTVMNDHTSILDEGNENEEIKAITLKWTMTSVTTI